jgi:DNA topoisomerase-1
VDRKAKLTIAYVDMSKDDLMALAQKFTDDNGIKRKDITKADLVSVFKAGTSAGSSKAWANRANNALPDVKAITFTGKEKGKGWRMADGSPLTKEVQDAISRQKGAIPPAWTDVKVNTDPNAKCIITGYDSKGREQRRYSTAHAGEAAANKFARISELQKHIPKLLKQSTADMLDAKKSDRERDDAATVNLVLKTGFRPGSNADTGAEEQAYGASNLQKRHIKLLKDGRIHFHFTGKKGVDQNKYLKDKDLYLYLSAKLETLGNGDQVFQSSSQSAGKYLKGIAGDQFKVKDLRTWNGTALARKLVQEYEPPDTEKEFKAIQNAVGDAVSEHLGNTRSVAISSYIDPAVWPPVTSGMKSLKKAA